MLNIEYSTKDFEEMWNMCHGQCWENVPEAEKIRDFAENYQSDKAIRYYTENSRLFRLLNRAFRGEDFDTIFSFGCYVSDLHNQLKDLSDQQRRDRSRNIQKSYRGKKFTTDMIQQFKDNIGHLIALNGLISTTKNYMTSRTFAGTEETLDDYHSVIFTFNIDSDATELVRPYADISEYSAFPDEEEVLFFMGFVWRIKNMEQENNRTWHIELEHCTDYNPELVAYIEASRKHCTYYTMGNILLELGDNVTATSFYWRMLSHCALTDDIRSDIYYKMALQAQENQRYHEAENFYKEAIAFIPSATPQNHDTPMHSIPVLSHSANRSRLPIFNNMGMLYMKMRKSDHARQCFVNAIKESGSDVEQAAVYNNLAQLEFYCRNLEKAREYANKAVQLAQNDVHYSEFKQTFDLIENHLKAH